MMSALEIDGRYLSPIKEAAVVTTYSRDYITRLAREGKIVASYIGRQWFVDVESLRGYAASVALEQEIRKRQLSEERKRQRQLREVTESQRTLHLKKADSLHTRSLIAASLVLSFGLISGFVTYQLMSASFAVKTGVQTAQVVKQVMPEANMMPAQTGAAVIPSNDTSKKSASVEQRGLGGVSEGVLLLPETGVVEDVSALFSDNVEVRQAADGSRVVVPVDASGNQIGNEVPFVVVPVNHR